MRRSDFLDSVYATQRNPFTAGYSGISAIDASAIGFALGTILAILQTGALRVARSGAVADDVETSLWASLAREQARILVHLAHASGAVIERD